MSAPTPAAPASLATRAAEAFAAYRSGDAERIGELVDLMTPILWHTARAQRADAATAEDVVQTAWLKLVDSAENIHDPQAVMQWLITTVRREAWRLVRRSARDRPEDELGELADPLAAEDPEAVSILSERQRVLWCHVTELPERCRELLRVIAFADRPDYAAIADALNMPVGSIGPTRGRCLQKLRTALLADAGWGG
ncbi:RNA polymerase sigma factor [Pedococcus sp. 5OH_020]|uniref:RNA polymerase sigma factor n=1 Tax=Pedococcus sp. 5OH_020 TaxID=2989814 RepID=UPI0022E9C880|nr:sigma-70 family RNA polymerase sigma factor [Pedococcus sp. 5OH_020]